MSGVDTCGGLDVCEKQPVETGTFSLTSSTNSHGIKI